MTWLSGELHPTGWISSKYPGLGIKGSDVTNNGTDGASVLFNDNLNPNDEYRVDWTTAFTTGTAQYFEDGSFIIEGLPEGDHTASYQHYENNVAIGSPQLVTVQVTSAGVEITSTVSGGGNLLNTISITKPITSNISIGSSISSIIEIQKAIESTVSGGGSVSTLVSSLLKSVISAGGSISTAVSVVKSVVSSISEQLNVDTLVEKQITLAQTISGTSSTTTDLLVKKLIDSNINATEILAIDVEKRTFSTSSVSELYNLNTEISVEKPYDSNVSGGSNVITAIFLEKETGNLVISGTTNVRTAILGDFNDTNNIFLAVNSTATELNIGREVIAVDTDRDIIVVSSTGGAT